MDFLPQLELESRQKGDSPHDDRLLPHAAALRCGTDLIRLAPEACAARPCDNVAADKTSAVEHFEKDAATCGVLWRAVFRLPRQ